MPSSDSDSSNEESHRKHHKSHKDKKKDKKKKKSKKEGKEVARSKELDSSDQITADDYFLRAREFKYWLKTSRETAFDTLSSKESRRLFDKFVKKWNSGGLENDYYNGLPEDATTTTYSAHKWGFAKKLSAKDAQVLESARDSVYVANKSSGPSSGPSASASSTGSSSSSGSQAKRPREESSRGEGGGGLLVTEHEEKEKAKMEEFRRSMGLQEGQRIQIMPRPGP